MNEASMSSLNAQITRFRMMDNHESGCNSLKSQPKQEGFQYDYYVIMHCDCFLALKNPTQEEKIKFVRHMATRFGGVHTQKCNTSNPVLEKYRDKMVYVTLNCTCWLAEVDKPAPAAYTEPMTNYIIIPTDREPMFMDTGRTYPNQTDARRMLMFQGYSNHPDHPDYWGLSNRIVTVTAYEAELAAKEPNPAQPVIDAIKAQVHAVRANALGPHLDTPIYDQLAREYDKKYNTMDYFETALAQKLKRMGQHHL